MTTPNVRVETKHMKRILGPKMFRSYFAFFDLNQYSLSDFGEVGDLDG
jgi:hypothetical protein